MTSAKMVLAAVATLAVLSVVVHEVMQAARHTFTPRLSFAQADPSTPLTQNGLTLMDVEQVGPAQTVGLRIKLPDQPQQTGVPICQTPYESLCTNFLTLKGRDSDGQTFLLPWTLTSQRTGNGPVQLTLMATVPSGYPATVRWLDVRLDDHHGSAATWRITHLPPMQHVLPPPVRPQTAFQVGGIHVTARVERGIESHAPDPHPTLLYSLRGNVTGAAHSWEVGHVSMIREWEPPGYAPEENSDLEAGLKSGSVAAFSVEPRPVYWNAVLPDLAEARWVRLSARLQEYETYDETVTFLNLTPYKTKRGETFLTPRSAQTALSPSGIPVRLVDVQNQASDNLGWVSGNTAIRLEFPATQTFARLPQSPLWRRYHRPITVSLDTKPPFRFPSAYGDTTGTTVGLWATPWPSRPIARLPVTLRQRVDLRSVPMTFTLPVQDGPEKKTKYAP